MRSFEESDNGESIVTALKDGPTKQSLAATGVINKYVYEQHIPSKLEEHS